MHVEAGHLVARDELDVVLGVPALGVDQELLADGAVGEVVLGEGRPLVGRVGLLADQHDPAVVAAGPQCLGCLGAGEPGSDDHHRVLAHEGLLSSRNVSGGGG